MMPALASGVLLGLSAGLAPGPMLALVLAQTLRYGTREGCKIVLTPLVTDVPIILTVVDDATIFRRTSTSSAQRGRSRDASPPPESRVQRIGLEVGEMQ